MIRKLAVVLVVAAVGCHADVGGTGGPLGAGATPPMLVAEGWLNGDGFAAVIPTLTVAPWYP